MDKDNAKVEKISATVGVKLAPRDLQGERKTLLSTILGQWQPLARAVLDTVCARLPSPASLHRARVDKLLFGARAAATYGQVSSVPPPPVPLLVDSLFL